MTVVKIKHPDGEWVRIVTTSNAQGVGAPVWDVVL